MAGRVRVGISGWTYAGWRGDFFAQLPRTTTEAAILAAKHDDKVADDRALTSADADRPLRHALEFRSTSYCTPEAYALLRQHDVACVVADTAGRWPYVEERTSDHRYVRLHGDTELYTSGYGDASLDVWAEKCRCWAADGEDVYVYFDNDAKGFAPPDAVRLLERLDDPDVGAEAVAATPPPS